MKSDNYLHYYFLENYLFFNVNENFMKNHRLTPFEFFSIIRWQSEKDIRIIIKQLFATSKKLDEIPRSYKSNIDYIVKKITRELYSIKSEKEKFEFLYLKWKIPYKIAFSILSVVFPEQFLIVDKTISEPFFVKLKTKNIDNIWEKYLKYKAFIERAVPGIYSLNDKVRFLIGKEAVNRINNTIYKSV